MDDFRLIADEEPAAPAPPSAPPAPQVKRSRGPVVRRPFTPLEQERAETLVGCRLPPASFTKRFARTIAEVAGGDLGITEPQAIRLEALCWTFRRQLPTRLVPASKPAACR